LIVIVARHLAQAKGLNDGKDGFADSGTDRLAIDVQSHVRMHQRLDIERSVLALHLRCSSVKGSGVKGCQLPAAFTVQATGKTGGLHGYLGDATGARHIR
jgi:hypothetical protein